MLKVIFFDLYQTLLDVQLSTQNTNHEVHGWNAFAKALEKYEHKISGAEIQDLYTKRKEDFYAQKDRGIFHHNLLQIIEDILDKDLRFKLSQEEIITLLYEHRKASRGWLRLYPGVFEMLSTLSQTYTLDH